MIRLAMLLLCIAACSGHPSAADCGRAADRMIDIFTAPMVGESGKPAEEARQASEVWKKNLLEKDPTRESLIATCQTKMSDGHVACILGAVDELSLAKCFGG